MPLIERAVLRNGLIFLELGLPLRLVQRRQRAHDRLPFGDRKAGFGKPRRAADQNHGEHKRGDGIKPQPDRARMLFRGAGRHLCSLAIDALVWRARTI